MRARLAALARSLSASRAPSASIPPGADSRVLKSILGAAVGLGLFVLVLLFDHADLSGAKQALRQAPQGLAISFLVHVPQLVLTALAWRSLLPGPGIPSVRRMVGLRWVRESLNALIPAGAIIGQALAARRLARAGVPADLAGATATVDMTIEAGTQALLTLVGLVLLLFSHGDRHLGWIAVIGMALAVTTTVAMVAVQRNLPVRVAEATLARLVPRWSALQSGWLADFQSSVLRLHADWRTLARAAVCHVTAWTLGAVEISGILWLLGHPVSLVDGFIVETLTQALRSAAFMVPGALGVQEGAIIAACALVGAPPNAALMLALLRRTREVALGALGLFAVRGWRLRYPLPGRQPMTG